MNELHRQAGGEAGAGETGLSWRLVLFTFLFWLVVLGFLWLAAQVVDCGFRDDPEACLSDQRRQIVETIGIAALFYAAILYARHRYRNA
jgi:hypothetical protein